MLPQALSPIVPAFGSVARSTFKWTAIVSFIGVQELIYVGSYIRGQTFEAIPVFCLPALYWILNLICAAVFRILEHLLPLNRALRRAHFG